MGCPVPKITGKKSNSGAALLKDHERAVEIVKAVKRANSGVVVSVKTRLGWSDEKDILEFAPKLEKAGADAITLHGRTRSQGYSGKANWEMIGKVKERISIPLIANGDVSSEDHMARCLKVTKADGVMIGRGALGNPWIFNPSLKKDLEDIKKVVLVHAQLHLEHYGQDLCTFRKHLVYYFKGMEGVKEIRKELVKVKTIDDLSGVLSSF